MEAIDFQSGAVIPLPLPPVLEGSFDVLLTEVEVAEALDLDGPISRALKPEGSSVKAPALLSSGLDVNLSTATRQQFLKVRELCDRCNVSRSWVYKRTRKGALDPLPIIRIGGLKFDAELVRQYIAARQRPATGGTLSSSDGNARVNGKGYRSLTRRRFQTGYVRLREDREPKWWEGFYREDVVGESGKIVRKRKSVNLGLLAEIPTKRSAQRKLAEILAVINDANYRPRSTFTFSRFVKKYRELKMPTKKGTTQHGYEVNLRKHFIPYFGEMQLSEIDTETVQAFLNQKVAHGYAFDTLKNRGV